MNTYRVFRVTLQQHTLNMLRHATIDYPKDLGTFIIHADLFPGAHVIEGGFGSGALSMPILSAIGSGGHLTTYALR
jgi:tRNA (adenine57-N1/adenine58-N1)-methyltransferase catalytic subunit